MTPKCGRIDVKYANCSYHTRIGLGKWTHDPTLVFIIHDYIDVILQLHSDNYGKGPRAQLSWQPISHMLYLKNL